MQLMLRLRFELGNLPNTLLCSPSVSDILCICRPGPDDLCTDGQVMRVAVPQLYFIRQAMSRDPPKIAEGTGTRLNDRKPARVGAVLALMRTIL